jgi:hypothetical protein
MRFFYQRIDRAVAQFIQPAQDARQTRRQRLKSDGAQGFIADPAETERRTREAKRQII